MDVCCWDPMYWPGITGLYLEYREYFEGVFQQLKDRIVITNMMLVSNHALGFWCCKNLGSCDHRETKAILMFYKREIRHHQTEMKNANCITFILTKFLF